MSERSSARFRTGLLLTAVLSVLACGPAIRFAPLGTAYPPRAEDAEVLLFSEKVPECEFEELGIVTGFEKGPIWGADDVMEALKAEARERGGHAVVGLRASGTSDSRGDTGWSGTVVRFVDPTCRRQ